MLARLADPTVPPGQDTFDGLELLSLYGGLTLYLLALVGMELRMFGRLCPRLLLGAVVLAVGVLALWRLPVLADLTLVGVVFAALVLAQVVRDRDLRRRVRGIALEEQAAMEEEANLFRRRL